MTTDVWMPIYTGDFLKVTQRLTNAQRGAYVMLLIDYWSNGPPPADDAILAEISRCSTEDWAKLKSVLKQCLKDSLILNEGLVHIKWIDEEKQKAEKRQKRAKAGGAALAAKKEKQKERSSEAKAKLKPSLCDSTSPSPSNNTILEDSINTYASNDEKPNARKTDYTPEFNEFWQAYPRRYGSNPKKPAFASWSRAIKSGAKADEIAAGLENYSRYCHDAGIVGTERVCAATTFLNQERWKDHIGEPQRNQPRTASPADHHSQTMEIYRQMQGID